MTPPRRTIASALAAIAACFLSPGASAQSAEVQKLLQAHACLSCHGLKQSIEGPGYHEIAEFYKEHGSEPAMRARFENSIRAGSENRWGDPVMPAFGDKITPADAKALVDFILVQ